LVALECRFQIIEYEEVTWTDIRPIGRLGRMAELTALEIFFGPGWAMRCGIVKMHYLSWRTCDLLAVEDMRKGLDYPSREVPPVEPFPGWEPADEDDAADT
jgi:hypothetical protein